jgi:hypothetical protein
VLGYLVLNYWEHHSWWPDLLVYRANQWFLAEVKSWRDKLNENQKLKLEYVTSSSDRRAIECTKNRQCSLNHLSDFEFVGRHIAPLLLALRSPADSVAHISKFFRPFKEPPFSALPLFIRSRWIKKPVQLRRSQVESRRSSFLGSRLDWLRYCERLLEKTANGFRTGQLSILTRNPSIQSRKLGRL